MGARDRHQAKKQALNALGRSLSRRARSKCELCKASEGLAPVLTMAKEEPDLDNVLLLCARCTDVFTGRPIDDPDGLRFLEEMVWSEEPLVQAVAVRMLERLTVPWSEPVRENLWLPDEARARVDGLDP